jgi:hypothetical protein
VAEFFRHRPIICLGVKRIDGSVISMTIKIGLIGGGNITETHARAVNSIPGLEIAAIQGTNAAKVRELSRQYGFKAYQDFESFLGHRPMDLVIISSLATNHPEHRTTQNTQDPDSGSMSESAGEVIRKSTFSCFYVQLFLLTKRWSSVYHHCHRG